MATSWSERVKPTTVWNGRKGPFGYATPLQDAYRKVHDQNNEIIYILANSGKFVPLTRWDKRTGTTTNWTPRPSI